MDAIISRAKNLEGTLTVPPDKAIAHRAVLLAAIARGATEIHPWPSADDCQRSLELIQSLGVRVRRASQAVWVEGRGADGLCAPTQDLFCGESGTTLRLAAGLLAGQPFRARLTGGPSLSGRPMRRIIEPLGQMGARVEGTPCLPGSHQDLCPPLTIQGVRPLKAIRYQMPMASAQVKSAVLLAGLSGGGPTTVVEPVRTRDHTERALQRFGVSVAAGGNEVSVTPGPVTSPGRLVLPGDVSSAVFFVVAACGVPGSRIELRDVGLNPTRTGWLAVLHRMGAKIHIAMTGDGWEPRGTLMVEGRPLRATTVEPEEVPSLIDELPILMVAAAVAQGTTRLRGLQELRVKETDRIRSMVEGLSGLGARIRVTTPETIEVDGGPLMAGEASSAGDHRTAMSLAVAALLARGGPSRIRGVECVSKSFPEFFAHLTSIAGAPTVKTVDKA